VQSAEAEIRQRQSSLRDAVSTALSRLLELQGEYTAQKQTLLAGGSSGSTIAAANRLLDPLSQQAEEEVSIIVYCIRLLPLVHTPDPLRGAMFPQQLGMVARIAKAYLAQRRLPGRGLADGLQQALEYVESPLDKMKRAGLGLLSKGFGR
jgi:hypothetical protein